MTIDSSNIQLSPNIIPREQHIISRRNISKAALKVLYRLNDAGFGAYLVGGSVRDLLLGGHPKDFDIATDATPEEVRKLFSNSRIIGRRFRLVHVRYGREILEVATFRGDATLDEKLLHDETGIIMRDNVFGSMENDAERRDFTINALYYNIADYSVVDYTNGMRDLDQKVLRVIGDPKERYREDPVRMLRAVRIAAKLHFKIAAESAVVLGSMADMLHHVAPARLFDELVKITMSGNSAGIYELLQKYGLFQILFPMSHHVLMHESDGLAKRLLENALLETDERLAAGKSVNPAFLIAVMLWVPLQQQAEEFQRQGMNLFQATAAAESAVLKEQRKTISIPKRLMLIIRDIWRLQTHLPQRRRSRIIRSINHPRFRAAYDFLLLRERSGEPLKELCEWWTKFQDVSVDEQEEMIIAKQRKRARNVKRPR